VAKDKAAASQVIIRVVSVLAVGAVAVALLVGFFFGGDFGAALGHLRGGGGFGQGGSLDSATVTVSGSARLDGSCDDATLAEQAASGAVFNARTEAEDQCWNLEGAPSGGTLRLKRVDTGDPVMEMVGSKCVARVEQTYTCLFDR
jgi:hypothetical protein